MTAAALDPVALFAQISQELSASGSTPLTASTDTVPAPKLTARGALQAILWITNAAVDMKGTDSTNGFRPWPVDVPDTILGHILDSRIEGLQTQALVAGLCEAWNRTNPTNQIDIKGIISAAQAQITGGTNG